MPPRGPPTPGRASEDLFVYKDKPVRPRLRLLLPLLLTAGVALPFLVYHSAKSRRVKHHRETREAKELGPGVVVPWS